MGEKASMVRNSALKVKVEKAAQESKKVEKAKRRASSLKLVTAEAKAAAKVLSNTVINIDIEKDLTKKASKDLIKRLSVKNEPNIKELNAEKEKASAVRA